MLSCLGQMQMIACPGSGRCQMQGKVSIADLCLGLFVLSEDLASEAIHVGACGGLMVAAQQCDMGWQSELPASQECQRLQAPCTSVHKVPCSHQCLLKRTAGRAWSSLNSLDSDLTCLRCREMTQLHHQQPYGNRHLSAQHWSASLQESTEAPERA